MKDSRTVEEIKSRIDIVDFVSRYVRLSKSGQNWKGLCPFHSEKTPSFTVNQGKQIFHCFGCGTGGDILSFLMKYENISFYESLRILAKTAGVKLPDRVDTGTVQRDERIRKVLQEACGFYTARLRESKKAGEYFSTRGISKESVEHFKLGYAPSGWNNLLKHLKSEGYDEAVIQAAGLVVHGEKGLYDMFRDRVVFPILSVTGNVLAFGGRSLSDGGHKLTVPKYINSPETAVFKKSETLFGLYSAKEHVRRENNVIIVEGYMDVIVCNQYGFRNVVAPLGTSLTSGHIRKLRTFTGSATVVFDGDAAGRAAARRVLPLICENDYKARVLLLPDGEDPDSYLRKHGSEAFRALLQKSSGVIDFLFSFKGSDSTEAVRSALTLIAGVRDTLVAGEMLTRLSERARIHESILREEFRKIKAKADGVQDIRPKKPGLSSRNSEEFLLLSIALNCPDKTDFVVSRINPADIGDKTLVSLFGKLAASDNKDDFANTILQNGDDEEKRTVAKFLETPGFDPEFVDKSIEDCFGRIEDRKVDGPIISDNPELGNTILLEKRKKMLKGARL